MLTLITPRPRDAGFTQAAEGAPLAVTAAPLAAGGQLLHAGAVVINKRAARHCVGGLSWGAEVIELNGRRRTREKYDKEEKLRDGRIMKEWMCLSLQ